MAFGTSIQLARAASLPKDPTRKKGVPRRAVSLRLQQFREQKRRDALTAPPEATRRKRGTRATALSPLFRGRSLIPRGRLAGQLSTSQLAIQQQVQGERAASQAAGSRLAQAENLLVGQGRAQQARIARQAQLSRGRAEQRLISSGLGNTTVVDPILRAIDERAALSGAQVSENVSRLRAGVIERVTDVPPSRGPILGLLGAAGAAEARRPTNISQALAPQAAETQTLAAPEVPPRQRRPPFHPPGVAPGPLPSPFREGPETVGVTRSLLGDSPTIRIPSIDLPTGLNLNTPEPVTFQQFVRQVSRDGKSDLELWSDWQAYRDRWTNQNITQVS